MNKKLASIRHNLRCGARIFKMDDNGKSMMSILVGIKDDQRRRSLCNTLETYKKELCVKEERLFIEKEKSCVEEMPNGSAKEQMYELLQKWQSGVELYKCIEEFVVNMSALESTDGEGRGTDEYQFDRHNQTRLILEGLLRNSSTQLGNVNISQPPTSQVCNASYSSNNTQLNNVNISQPPTSHVRDAS